MVYKKVKEICKPFSSSILINKVKDNHGDYPLWGAKGLVKNISSYQQDTPYISIVKWGAGVGRAEIRSGKTSIVATMQGILPNENIDIHWLCNALKFLHLEKYATKATVPNLYFRDYGEALLRVPDYEDQKRISGVLRKIETIIEKKEQETQKLDNLIKARFVEMFGDRFINDRSWQTNKLGECTNFTNGKAHEQVVDPDGQFILVTSKAIATNLKDVRHTNAMLSPLHTNNIVMVMSEVPFN